MPYEKIKQAADQVDTAHRKTVEQVQSASRAKASAPKAPGRRTDSRVSAMLGPGILILLLLGGISWGGYVIYQNITVPETPEVPEVLVPMPPPEQLVEGMTGSIDGVRASTIVRKDPAAHPPEFVAQGAVDSFNAILQAGRTPTARPLAHNLIGGYLDAMAAAVAISLGIAEIDQELLTVAGGTDAVEAAARLGQPIPDPRTLESKIAFVRRIDNILSLDPYEVVRTGFRAEETYGIYLRELLSMLEIAQRVNQEIQQEYSALETQAQQVIAQRNAVENEFRRMTAALETHNVESTLAQFHALSAEANTLRSRSSVLRQLQTLYATRIRSLQLRIQGVESNHDAIIKNIRVTPVPGSGVNLVQ